MLNYNEAERGCRGSGSGNGSGAKMNKEDEWVLIVINWRANAVA